MEPQDERASPWHRARAGLHGSTDRMGRSWAAAAEQVRRWDERKRVPSFVAESESVRIDVRRHPFVLVTPALRTLAGIVALVAGLPLLALLSFALLTAGWATGRFRLGLRRTATVAAAVTVALVVLALVAGTLLSVLLVLLWAAEDAADWFCDRLVVTDKRIYRRYGVLTQHSPSISLTAIAYLDASVPPTGRVLKRLRLTPYGTLSLDSVAQRDAPLSRFDYIADVVPVSHEILELRSRAMPKFPQSPL